MAKDNKKYWIIAIIALLLLWYGGNEGWFHSINNYSSSGGSSSNNQATNTPISDCSSSAVQADSYKDNINSANDCYATASQDCSDKGLVPETAYGYKLNGKCCTWKCITLPPATCSDTDSGQVFEVKGTCTSTNSEQSYEDYCWPSSNDVYEFNCNPLTKDCDGIKHTCENVCFQGKCLPTSHCSTACANLQGNYIGGLCTAYNSNGAMSTSQKCIQAGGIYEANAQACGTGDICCCVN